MDYVQEIRRCDKQRLRRLLGDVRARRTSPWPPGKAFEHLVLRAFDLEDVQVTWPFEVRETVRSDAPGPLEQIDGVVRVNGTWFLVESKDERGSINADALVKLRYRLSHRPTATIGLLFSTNGFTPAMLVGAHDASPYKVLLWEGEHLDRPIREGNMVDTLEQKLKAAVERGVMDYCPGGGLA